MQADIIGGILRACVDYWWVIAAALVVMQFVKPADGVEQAINEFNPENTHGRAGFADNKALRKAGMFTAKGASIPVGYSEDGRELHYSGIGMVLSVAAARMGKGLLLIEALLSWSLGAIIIDVKSENALVTAHFRRRFGPVYILSPFKMFPDELGSMFARYNPMQVLDTASLSFHADADKLAASVVWEEKGQDGRFFTDGARILVSGGIAALKRHAPKDKQNLVEVARIIGSGDGLFTFCREVVASTKDDFLRSKLERFALPEGKEPSREMSDVIATAITNLGFLNNAAIAESLSGSSFRFADVRRRKATIFICLPLSKLDITAKYFRLVLESALAELLNERIER
jgi:type IV secretion system protein VirD4